MALSAKGQHNAFWRREAGKASGSYPRLMRPRFPNPLSPSGDISSFALIPTTIAVGFERSVSHEHDDRRVEYSPTPGTVPVPVGMSRTG